MKTQNGALASTTSACLKKAIELFFVIHPNVTQRLLGPFPTAAEADDFIHGHTIKNGRVNQVFLGIATQRRHA